MFYALRVSLAFKTKVVPEEASKAIKYLLDNAVVINQGQDNEERGFIQLEKCYHDISPTIPCKRLKRWDVPYPP